jgi:hypothetical protein
VAHKARRNLKDEINLLLHNGGIMLEVCVLVLGAILDEHDKYVCQFR